MDTKKLQEFIKYEQKSLSKTIVATPKSREFLDSFSKANNGANDALLTQMAVQYGYNIALELIINHININKK
ncbi:MAG: hypothetical protein ABF260_04380 [Flavobacteriaceae bacterium]